MRFFEDSIHKVVLTPDRQGNSRRLNGLGSRRYTNILLNELDDPEDARQYRDADNSPDDELARLLDFRSVSRGDNELYNSPAKNDHRKHKHDRDNDVERGQKVLRNRREFIGLRQ